MKKIVPLTAGPGGERIGEVEMDLNDLTGPMTWRLYRQEAAELMAQLVQHEIVGALSIEPKEESLEISTVLPPEMRDTLGAEQPIPRVRYSPAVSKTLGLPKSHQIFTRDEMGYKP